MEPLASTSECQKIVTTHLDRSDENYARIIDMKERIIDNDDKLSELIGKKVVIVMGPTGAGKSTVANAIIQPDDVEVDDDTGYFSAPELIHNGRRMFTIGDAMVSCTALPGYYPLTDDVYLVDCPGLGDSNEYLEFPNQTQVHQIISRAASVLVVVVVKGASLEAARAEGLLRLMTSLLRMLTEAGIKDASKYVFPLVNNANNFRTFKQIEKSFEKVMEFLELKDKILQEAQTTDDPEYQKIKDQYTGVQYPNQEELGMAHYLMRVLKENFKCIDPMDDGINKFKERKMEIADVKQLIIEKFASAPSKPEYFASDLPKNLYEFMRDKIFDDILYAKDFQQSVEVRDQVSAVMRQLLGKWHGKYAKDALVSLQSSIDKADECGRNEIFGWYINCIAPIMRTLARAESAHKNYVFDTDVMPITMFLLEFFTEKNLCNPDDRADFGFEHWEFALAFFRKYIGKMKPIEKSGARYFPACPYSKAELAKFEAEGTSPPEQPRLTFEEVLKILEAAKFSADKDEKLKERWTDSFHSDFVQWFKLSAPAAYEMRDNKKTLMMMLSMQKFSPKFADAVIGTGQAVKTVFSWFGF